MKVNTAISTWFWVSGSKPVNRFGINHNKKTKINDKPHGKIIKELQTTFGFGTNR